MSNQSGIHQLVEAIQREAGHGCVKAVNLTVFIDAHGNIIGRTGLKVVRLIPREIEKHIAGNEEALAEVMLT